MIALLLVQASLAGEVTAVLSQPDPLRLVEYRFKGEKTGMVSLAGELEIAVRNDTETPVDLWSWDVMGLLLTDADGAPEVVVHPCACGFLAGYGDPPAETRVHLVAGGSTKIRISEWGCGGGAWKTPPQGSYTLVFRLARHGPAPQPGEPDLRTVLTTCEERVRALGEDAVVTAPIQVTLGKPKVERMR